jgi:hypothetical protein
MFPEESEVFEPESLPTFVMTDISCIEAVELWRRDDFGSPVSAEGSDHMDNERGFKDGWIVTDRRPARLLNASSIAYSNTR